MKPNAYSRRLERRALSRRKAAGETLTKEDNALVDAKPTPPVAYASLTRKHRKNRKAKKRINVLAGHAPTAKK